MPIIKLIVEGGNMKPGPTVAQQLGPMGINIGKVIEDVNKETSGFKGMKVPVEIEVDTKTKKFSIKVFSPPVAELIKKEIGAEKGSGTPHENKIGNLAIEQIISIAKTKHPNMLAKDIKAAVKLVVGSCVSLGVLIENKSAKEIERDIDSGIYDKEISEKKTEVDDEKRKKLLKYFELIKMQQEARAKAAEAAKAAEEAAKASTPAASTIGTTSTTTVGTSTTKAEKKEEKPKKK